ncbi:hypothetical protein JI435_414200 [Parastagonospora nodorum SN15]|uniref:Secreted protein n=1 Tax=Phaeosphaeria nodorum (strain SN15 / ATCC MYA-4574 / FGSC 10173) TaxID=321614 RepID=A0A7U2F6Z0_PHANO|nr:hypothetical protein JI435_414200 [Parastagonospora nodorum SN15]
MAEHRVGLEVVELLVLSSLICVSLTLHAENTVLTRKPRPMGEYAMMGIPSSAHVEATPFSRISVEYIENSISTAAIGCTACALRILCALTSLRLMPPSFPALTYSAIKLTVSSMGTSRSTRAHSKRSRNFLPSSRRSVSLMLRCMFSLLPLILISPGTMPPLMERTTLSASSGYLVKYSLSKCPELRSGVP